MLAECWSPKPERADRHRHGEPIIADPGDVVLMGTHLFCKQELRVRFSPSPPCRGYDVMVAYLLAMQDARVRFPLPAPDITHNLLGA
jgi:hypothetical protein